MSEEDWQELRGLVWIDAESGDITVSTELQEVFPGIDEQLLADLIQDNLVDYGDEVEIDWAGVEYDWDFQE